MRGSEKVVVGQERMAYNFVYTFKNKVENEPWVTEIRSLPKGIAALPAVFKLMVKYEKGHPRLVCKIKTLTKDVPFGVLMRALGLQNDLQIFNCVCERDVGDLSPVDVEDAKGLMEVIRYSLEQVTMYTENDCLTLLGGLIEKLRGVDTETKI